MIFVTVGTQLAFDRMLKMVDESLDGKDIDAFFQVGPSDYTPVKGEWCAFLDSNSYRSTLMRSKLIIGHAGMGTIITALEYGIPVIIVPRRVSLSEHRNDHQLATAERFSEMPSVYVVNNVEEMNKAIDDVFFNDSKGKQAMSNSSVTSFAGRIQNLIV